MRAVLVVILGAGASYDSVDLKSARIEEDDEDRPPLADQLFDSRPYFGQCIDRYPPLAEIVGELRVRLSQGQNLETLLERLQDDASNWARRHQQLAALRFYLWDVIHNSTQRFAAKAFHVTNYAWLGAELERWRAMSGDRVAYITFNYDSMLEQALGFVPSNMESYIADPSRQILKPHGSVDWGQSVPGDDLFPSPTDPIRTLITKWAELKFQTYEYQPGGMGNPGGLGHYYAPAIAIPVMRKTTFSFPDNHLDAMRNALAQASRLLVVGWRAQEEHFLAEWVNHHRREFTRGLVVCGDTDRGAQTNAKLAGRGLTGNVRVFGGGFTDLVGSDELGLLLD
jgi:hypothetical protein